MAENRSKDAPPSYDETISGQPSYVNSYAPMPVVHNSSTFDFLFAPASAPTYAQLVEDPAPSLPLYPQYIPPVRPVNVADDFLNIEKALNKASPDVDSIISILCHRRYEERLEIAQKYHQKFGTPLIQRFKRCLKADFGTLMNGLVIPYYEFLARTLHNSRSFKWFYYILFTVSNREIIEMKSYFKTKYNCSVEKFLKALTMDEHSSDQTRLRPVIRVLEGRRNDNEFAVNENEVRADVQKLSTIVGGSILGGSKEEKLIVKQIFYYKSFNHIKAVANEYTRQNDGKHICTIINKVYSSSQDIFMSMINYAFNKNYYYATLLKKSMKGLGTDSNLLMHVIVHRFNAGDLMDIKNEFNRQNQENLRKWISDDSSGNFKYALYALVGEQGSKT